MNEPLSVNDTLNEVLKRPFAARVLLHYGMDCVGCAIARFETLAEACGVYGVSPDELIRALDAAAAARENDQ
jgi:hybrid cluster-associated redox disulfide protein